jgi:hypothetical protein
LSYQSKGKIYTLANKGSFSIDNKTINLEYARYDSEYIKAPREPDTMNFAFEGSSLFLDFYNAVREQKQYS